MSSSQCSVFSAWQRRNPSRCLTSLIQAEAPFMGRTNKRKKPSKPMTVAVVGSGAVGSYYGSRLWEAGHILKFLLRGENYRAASENGLKVTSIDGDVYIPSNELEAYEETSSMGKVDWVLVALKTSSLDAVPDLIHPLLDPDRTRVLAVMNGLIEEDLIRMLKERFGETDLNAPLECCQSLYGGMAFLCSNRLEPAVVHHTYAGLLEAGVASTRATDSLQDETAFRELWKDNVVQVEFTTSLLRSRWKKMCWNAPFNGISTAMGITVDRIVQDPSLRELAYKIIDETIAVANADMERQYGKGNFEPLGESEREHMMFLSDGAGAYKTSTMLDLVGRRSMEVEYLFRKPIERAQRVGVPVPHLETLVAQIEALQRYYGLF